jgi:hypothetical protein
MVGGNITECCCGGHCLAMVTATQFFSLHFEDLVMQSSSARAQFWQWFKNNGARLRGFMYAKDEDARAEASAKLRRAIDKVEPGLIIEFAHETEGEPLPVIVSADGKPERVDAVKEFVASAPDLPGWNVIAFRPRMEIGESIEIVLEGEQVGADDIWFRVTEDDAGLDAARPRPEPHQ